MKMVFMGTPEFAIPTLEKLFHSTHQILAVVTQPDRPKGRGRELAQSPVKQFARNAGLPVLQPERVNTPEFTDILRGLNPDLIVVVAFGQILTQKVLDIPKTFCINVHSSILPQYRGAAPINRAIINGDSETGVTTMKMDRGMDTGDILLCERVPIKDSDDAQTLHDALAQAGGALALETVRRLEENSLTPIPQESSQATYAPKLNKKDGLINWSQDALSIRNLVRGMKPWPGAFTFYQSKRLRIDQSEIARGEPSDQAGVIARVSDHGIEVGTGKDRLIITGLQPEGKKIMGAKNFLTGHKINPGETFDANSPPIISNQD